MIYLKAPDSDTFYEALKQVGWKTDTVYRTETIPAVTTTVTDETGVESEVIVEPERIVVFEEVVTEGETILESDAHKLELIGSIWQNNEAVEHETGVMIADRRGSDEFHANLLMKDGSDCPEALQAFVIEAPATPYREFENE